MAKSPNASGSSQSQNTNRDASLERDRQPQQGAGVHDASDPRNQAKDSTINPDPGRQSDTKDDTARKNPKSTQARGVSHAARGSTKPE